LIGASFVRWGDGDIGVVMPDVEWRAPGDVFDVLLGYQTALGWATAASLLMLAGSTLLIYVFVTRTPADYFAQPEPPPSPWAKVHPAAAIAMRIARNVAGLVLVMAGIAMLVLPGQGLLTILLGIMLLEVPGKRRVELMLLRRPEILAGLNWIRRHANRPPFEVCEEG
jgi:hypothetical protein